MRRRAIIHIGTFKTGSTSIQYFLNQNRDLLNERGYYVPQSLGAPNQHGLAVYALSYREVTGLIRHLQLEDRDKREKVRENFARMLAEELQTLGENTHTVLFSNEHLSGLNTIGEIETVNELISPYFDQITIVVYLRRQDLRIVSDYTQKVRDGHTEPLDLLNYEPAEGTDYFGFLSRWAEVFGEASIAPRIFAREKFRNGDLIEDYCRAADIPLNAEFKRPAAENSGLSHKATLFLRAMNEIVPAYHNGSRNTVRDRLLPYLASMYPGRGITPDPDSVAELLEKVRTSNEALGEKYFSGGNPFSAADTIGEAEGDLSSTDAIEIAAHLWTRQSSLINELRREIKKLCRENELLQKNDGLAPGLQLLLELFRKNDPAWNDYFPSLVTSFEQLFHELAGARARITELEKSAENAVFPSPNTDTTTTNVSPENGNRA